MSRANSSSPVGHARRLRRDSTDAERLLWRRLRSRGIQGVKFRRQQPIGPYITDFVSFERRLVIELDGGQHIDDPADRTRDAWFAAQGYRVLRFWDNDVLRQPDAVLQAILDVVSSPHPASPPRGEEQDMSPKGERCSARTPQVGGVC